MDILNPRSLRDEANRALARGREPKKLVFVYAAIGGILSLLVTLLNLWLDNEISGTGGLGNLGTRAIFSTAQQVIPLVSSVAAMCLEFGYFSGMMRIARGQYADHTDLKVGFQKFWPLVRLTLLQYLVYLAVGILAVQLATIIFYMTPWALSAAEALQALSVTDMTSLTPEIIEATMEAMMPMYVISGVVFLICLIPVLHRLRMAHFCLLDEPNGRAMAAIRSSSKMMRRRFLSMLKIDLSLWLYYAGTAVMLLLMYTDYFFAFLGIPAPMDPLLFSFAVYGAALVLQFVIQIKLRNRVEAVYLTAYDRLREKPREGGPVVLGNIFDM